jgi:hypothetical protein
MGTKTYKRLFQRLVVTGTPQSTESLGKNPNIVPMTNSFGPIFRARAPAAEVGKHNDLKLPTGSGGREFEL